MREDLYYRLNVVNIHLPPLRERCDDVCLLAEHFLEQYADEHERNFKSISPEVRAIFQTYVWPGNVRELQNCIQQIVVLNDAESIESHMLPEPIRSLGKSPVKVSVAAPSPTPPPTLEEESVSSEMDAIPSDRIITLAELEKKAIDHALRVTQGNVGQAAVGLDMSQATLYRKVRDYGLDLKDYK